MSNLPTLAQLVADMDEAAVALIHADRAADAATAAFVAATRRQADALAAYEAAVNRYHQGRTQAGLGAEQS